MERREIEDRLMAVIGAVLMHPVPMSVTRESDSAWDSLKHIQIVFAVEEQFKVRFLEEEIAGIASLADLATILQERLGPKS